MLLPAVERRGEIRFHVAKNLSYRARLWISFALIIVGLMIQIVFVESFARGFPLLLAGSVLLLVSGYDNRGSVTRATEQWRTTTRNEAARIIEINEKSKDWDSALVDITCVVGFSFLLGMAFLVFLLSAIVERFYRGGAAIVVIDAILLLFPFWVTGVRSILKNNELIVRTKFILELSNYFEGLKREGEEFRFQIMTLPAKRDDGAEGDIPRDLKGLISFQNAPASFLGIQLQVVINDVQGTSYPYCYAVVVARKELEGIDSLLSGYTPSEILLERKNEHDVNVIVIRQMTTKKSGYHTDMSRARQILSLALTRTRQLISKSKPDQSKAK